MPTPFMHLQMAEKIRALPTMSPQLARLIEVQLPAFYLGHVAPDLQIICDIPREDTHFYPLPPDPHVESYAKMWEHYPQLKQTEPMSADQAMFLAGYIAHLKFDTIWFFYILDPYFLQPNSWQTHRERFLSHTILLIYLDNLAWQSLPANIGSTLSAAESNQWLPFATDSELHQWRDMLCRQLQNNHQSETTLIYAERLNMPLSQLEDNLKDETWMNRHLFDVVPLAPIQAILEQTVLDSLALIQQYLLPQPTLVQAYD